MCGRPRAWWLGSAVVALGLFVMPAAALAQTGRVGGQVKDESGQPLKGATVQAENPGASPSSFSAVTDDKGRYSMIGLKAGTWTFTASAPGFQPQGGQAKIQTLGTNPPINFTLPKGGPGGGGGLAGANTKELQADLQTAETYMSAGQYDDAIKAYEALLVKAPTLTAIHLEIGRAHRMKKDYASALKSYQTLLDADPTNEKAIVAIGMTNLEKGDFEAADKTLSAAAELPGASREVFYNLGEVKFSKQDAEGAAKWYQKAADADPTWGKPIFKLGLVALNKGDQAAAATWFEKVLAVDPSSQEAAQAKAVLGQLKK
ncbi:MAG: tetratricopeptide repeat protein [Vicinamibacterales bacterium]